jgi:hypothetical protein
MDPNNYTRDSVIAPNPLDPSPAAVTAERLREIKSEIYEYLDIQQANGKETESPTVLMDLAVRWDIPRAQASKIRMQWYNEQYKHREMELKLKQKELELQHRVQQNELNNCPYCSRMQADLNSKTAEFLEIKRDLKEELAEMKRELREAEKRTKDLEIQNSKLQFEVNSKPREKGDEEPWIAAIKQKVIDTGLDGITGPKSDTMAVTQMIMQKAPELMKEGAGLIRDIRSDQTGENIYPQDSVQPRKQQQKPRPVGNPPQRISETMQKKAPAPRKLGVGTGLNKLGEAYKAKFPQVPTDVIKCASDYYFEHFREHGKEQMAKMMHNSIRLVGRIREIGAYVKRIREGRPVAVLNRPIIAEEAAEFLWKEQHATAIELSQMDYAEMIGYLAPFSHHPVYKADYEFFVQQETIVIIEQILEGLYALATKAREESNQPTPPQEQ